MFFCHTLTRISHGCTCVLHPELPTHLTPHPIPLGHTSAPALSTLSQCIEPGLLICFIYDNIHVSGLFSQIIAPLPSPTESKTLFYTSVSLLLSHIQGYHYHLSKFCIYALVQRSAFFIVQLSHPYMTTGKTIALDRTFLAK